MGRSDFRGAVQPGHASLAAIFRREKPDVLQDCRCSARQTAAPYRATMEAFHDLRLDSRTFETRSRPALARRYPSRLYLLSRKSLSSIVRLLSCPKIGCRIDSVQFARKANGNPTGVVALVR